MKPVDHTALIEGAIPVPAPLVVHVVRQFLPNRGGLEDVVYNLARQSLLAGYRVRVVTLNSLFSDRARRLPDREIIDGIEVVRIPWRGSSRYPLAPAVLRHIGDAALVHVHAIDFFFDFLALTRPFHRRPMIATTHGGFFHTRRFAAIKEVWFRTLTRFSASRYVAVVGCSKSDLETFRTVAPHRTHLIENGTNTEKFTDAASTDLVKGIVTIGRFSINKRLDRLIEAMAVLVRQDPEWRLDIVGVPSDLSVADLEGLAAAAGMTGHIAIHPDLNNADIRALMARCSFFASASEYEGFGLVAIEAMSAGLLPVLESNRAYRSLAARHDTIALTDFSDPDRVAGDLQQAYRKYAEDGAALRPRMRDQAESHDWRRTATAYFALYGRCLGSSRIPAPAVENGRPDDTRSQVQ